MHLIFLAVTQGVGRGFSMQWITLMDRAPHELPDSELISGLLEYERARAMGAPMTVVKKGQDVYVASSAAM